VLVYVVFIVYIAVVINSLRETHCTVLCCICFTYAPEWSYNVMAQAVRLSEPTFGTYGFIFCMKIVGKLIKKVFRG